MNHERRRSATYGARWVAIASIMSALALVGNYSLVAVPNVELGTTVLFITSTSFGLPMGIWCTLIMSVIFGTINPWGPFVPQIWITQVIGWAYVAVAGGLVRRIDRPAGTTYRASRDLFIVGLFVTAMFDSISNIGYSLAFSVPYSIAMIAGLPFMAAHVLSNGVLFSLVIPRVESIIGKEFGPALWSGTVERLEVLGEE
ncbi:MAG: hypothetical protein JSW61_12705 [Candidatus Thorarchaeota archaeon]|nr:MAG: hypothetical protein JSW61_12705 [Candidatus Thorarchaeota archaeon]